MGRFHILNKQIVKSINDSGFRTVIGVESPTLFHHIFCLKVGENISTPKLINGLFGIADEKQGNGNCVFFCAFLSAFLCDFLRALLRAFPHALLHFWNKQAPENFKLYRICILKFINHGRLDSGAYKPMKMIILIFPQCPS